MIVTLTARADMKPVPRVEIEMQDITAYDGGNAAGSSSSQLDGGGPAGAGPELTGGTPGMTVVTVPDGTERVTLWRRDGDRRREVRGVVDVAFSGGSFGALDREPGRGAESSYELECFTDLGTTSTIVLGKVLMPAPEDEWETVIQQPFNAGLHAVVTATAVSVESVARQAPADLVYLEGRGYPRLIGFGPRRSAAGVQLSFEVEDRATAAAVWATLGDEENPQLAAWLVRSTHPLLPRVFFCEVRDVQEVDVTLSYGGARSRFVATVTEIEPPAPGLTTPAVRYSDLVAAIGPSYAAIGAALPRYGQWGTAWDFASAG